MIIALHATNTIMTATLSETRRKMTRTTILSLSKARTAANVRGVRFQEALLPTR